MKETLYISRVDPFIGNAYVDLEFNEPRAITEVILTTRNGPRIYVPERFLIKNNDNYFEYFESFSINYF